MTQDKILDKLAKLKASAESEAAIGNSAAAEAFAGMLNSLLLKHELSIEDIKLKDVEEPIIEARFDPRDHGMKFSKSRIAWQETLCGIVAEAHLCKFLVTPGTNYVTFVGTATHTAFASHSYAVLAGAADRMSIKARDEYWRLHRDEPGFQSGNYRAAWLSGFIGRIYQRFKEARAKEVAATVNTGTALMRLDQALVRAKQHVDDKYKKKAKAPKLPTGCYAGREAGRKAADDMHLGQKGVSGNNFKGIGGGR